jgi:predicted metal-dependent peptidase
MSSHKHSEHIEKIKNAIKISGDMDDSQKSQTMKHIDEWILEDKAEGIFYNELIEMAKGIKPILEELGLK